MAVVETTKPLSGYRLAGRRRASWPLLVEGPCSYGLSRALVVTPMLLGICMTVQFPLWSLANARSSVAVSPMDFPPAGDDIYLLLNHNYVLSARPTEGCRQGEIGLTDAQRTWAGVSLGPHDVVEVEYYDPFSKGNKQVYLGSVDAEVGFAGKRITDTVYDQDELAQLFIRVCSAPTKTLEQG